MDIDIELRFRGELTFRLPIPNTTFRATGADSEIRQISIEEIQVPRHPDQGDAVGVDDGMGNYTRSRIHLWFITRASFDQASRQVETSPLREQVLSIVNRFIDTCRYVARDPKLVTVYAFPGESVYHVYELRENGETGDMLCAYSEINTTPLPSPFDLALALTLNQGGINALTHIFGHPEELNPSWLLWIDAKRDAHFRNINRCILNLGVSIETHIENLVERYRGQLPASINPDDINYGQIYSLYDEELLKLVGSSLHSRADLFRHLEYIRVLRNSVAHKWIPLFEASRLDSNKYRSRYLADHITMDRHVVTGEGELQDLVDRGGEILKYVESLFAARYP